MILELNIPFHANNNSLTLPSYTEEQMQSITVQHRSAKNIPDKIALGLMRFARWGLDTATFYAKERPAPSSSDASQSSAPTKQPTPWLHMDERKWLIRIVFLESIAGVPGMVGGMLRHLHSLRRMKRDNGWIETLLEESYNERMHLLTFIKIAEPGLFMRTMILLAQGVFFNGFTAAYLVAPRACHRFVGYLEEEAVYTYSRIIREVETGALPRWADPKFEIPDIAVEYWKIPEGKRTMRDLLLYVRADEAKHREVNHTLGNLDQKTDPNPYASEYTQAEKDKPKALPSKGLENHHPLGWERNEVL